MVTYITYKKNKTTRRPVCQIERGAIQPGGQVGRLNLGGEDANVAAVDADTFSLFIKLLQDMWEDVKMRVPALAPSNLGGACNIMKVQVILLMITNLVKWLDHCGFETCLPV